MIHFDRLHSIDANGNLFIIRTLDAQNQIFEWSIPKEVAAMLAISFQQVSKPHDASRPDAMIHSIGFQTIVADDMTPGIQIQISENLYLNLLMPNNQIDALLSCIQQLKGNTSFIGPTH
jgi:hypothetical protein